jgi:hypothetical protein
MVTQTDGAAPALERLVGILCEDAVFVLSATPRDAKEALDAVLSRRGPAYAAAVQGQEHTRMSTAFEPWVVEMARAMAPVWPPAAMPMMDVVREKVTLEIGARGLRSLFSSKPSDKDVARVKHYGFLAVRLLRAVLSADGPTDEEERTMIAALVASLGLPEADANQLHSEGPIAAETIDIYGDLDEDIVRGMLRGAWLAAMLDGLDPREEQVIAVVARKLGVTDDAREALRKEALARVEARRKTGTAAVDAVRYVLSDRPMGAQLSMRIGRLMLPRHGREQALAPPAPGTPLALGKRHAGLDAEGRHAVLGVAWAAAMADDPSLSRKALLRARWEKAATDLDEDDPASREVVETWIGEALAGVARTLP